MEKCISYNEGIPAQACGHRARIPTYFVLSGTFLEVRVELTLEEPEIIISKILV